jgi:hypothetical protein
MPVEESVFGEQVRQMDKAREQAQKMEGRMDDLNRQLEGAGE